jgi:head-tail adaptor
MKICLRCRRKRKRGGNCPCGGRMVVQRRKASRANDAKILNWLEKVTDEGGVWATINVHDSRDMGYKEDFVTVTVRNEIKGKGNSLREALADAAGLSNREH